MKFGWKTMLVFFAAIVVTFAAQARTFEEIDDGDQEKAADVVGNLYWPNGRQLKDLMIKVEYMTAQCEGNDYEWSKPNGTYALWVSPGNYYVRSSVYVNGTTYDSCWLSVIVDGTYQVRQDLTLKTPNPNYACRQPLCPIEEVETKQ